MTQLTLDEFLRGKLHGCKESVEILDEAGQPVGHFLPEEEYQKLLHVWVESQCPFSPEELEKFSNETDGRSLGDIWMSLGVR